MSICMHSVSVVDEVHKSSKSIDSLIKYYSNKNVKYSFSITRVKLQKHFFFNVLVFYLSFKTLNFNKRKYQVMLDTAN